MVNLQVYQPVKPKERPPVDPSTFIASTVPNVYYPPQMGIPPYMGTFPQTTNPLNVIKNYQISTMGPNDDHTKLSYIFEDVLPTKNISVTPTTVSERITMLNYLRSIMFSKGDGSQVNLDGKDSNSLISHIKFMDINPYNTYKFSNNPYRGLPDGFLIYRCCYPIRHEAMTSTVSCARNSMGANVRIYKLINEAYQVNKSQNTNLMEYDVWRDIAYYEYIREQIIKKKESPNFVLLYGYYLNENSKIDFDKISMLKGEEVKHEQKYISTIPIRQEINVNQVVNNIPLIQSNNNPTIIVPKPNLMGGNMPNVINVKDTSKFPLERKPIIPNTIQTNFKNTNCHLGPCLDTKIPMVFYSNPKAYTGKVLVALTESPIYNLYNWSSKIYQAEGNVRRMINTGFHSDKVWYSVLFQIMVILYCLQIHGIIFNNFDIESNIYIKDINPHGNVTNYWKYKIDGIDYYIPNYGYLVLFDSSFKENTKSDTSVILLSRQKYKISGKPFNDNMPDNEIKLRTFDQFKKTFNTNIFSQSYVDLGGVKPSPEILRFLEKIMDQVSKDKINEIGEYFYKFMRQFMNNRIGTYLKETEVSNIRKNDLKDFVKGNIIVYEESANTYRFVLFYGQTSPGVFRILNKDIRSNEVIEMDVAISVLYQYSRVEPIIQNFKINESNLNEDDLLETYILNKN